MTELEFKFELTAPVQAWLRAAAVRADEDGTRGERGTRERLRRGGRRRLASAYYDTRDGELAAAGMTLRVRRAGGRWWQAVKAQQADPFERFEWERPIRSARPQRDALPPPDTPIGAQVHRCFERLAIAFRTDFTRTTWQLDSPGGLRLELARDVGAIDADGANEPVCELEIEHLAGPRQAFLRWVSEWIADAQPVMRIASKSERGWRLARGIAAAEPVARAAVTPAADTPASEASAQALRECLMHALANVEPVLSGTDPEGPHQLRVALRRFRAALRLFALRRQPQWRALDAGARALAAAAAELREIDVLQHELLPALRESHCDEPHSAAALAALERALSAAADLARRALRAQLRSPRLAAFAVSALLAIDTLAAPGNGPPQVRAERFAGFAAARLRELLRRLRRRARNARSTREWHRTRIAVKNLRYSLQFGRGALPQQPVTGAADALARWQQALGRLQDAAVAHAVAERALSRAGVEPAAAARALALVARRCQRKAPDGSRPRALAADCLRA
ncbi:MAG TPA: CHAD domain-containing protein, partial [Burkholderiaceae bacterium]|nr:CHAD domain-containing protein [Burkholderiaceae bacterium]